MQYVIIRHDGQPGKVQEMNCGTVEAANHREAVTKAQTFVHTEYQWIECINVKTAPRGKVSSAKRIDAQYGAMV